jgi:hypothetical protein
LIVANAIIFSSSEVSEFEKEFLSAILLLVLFCTLIFSCIQLIRKCTRLLKRLAQINEEKRQQKINNTMLKSICNSLKEAKDAVGSLNLMSVSSDPQRSFASPVDGESEELQIWRDAAIHRLGPVMFSHAMQLSIDVSLNRKIVHQERSTRSMDIELPSPSAFLGGNSASPRTGLPGLSFNPNGNSSPAPASASELHQQ